MDYTFIENEGQCKVTVSLRNVAVVKQVLFIDNQRFAIVFTSNSHLFQKAHAKQACHSAAALRAWQARAGWTDADLLQCSRRVRRETPCTSGR
jgi:hypothetical protein